MGDSRCLRSYVCKDLFESSNYIGRSIFVSSCPGVPHIASGSFTVAYGPQHGHVSVNSASASCGKEAPRSRHHSRDDRARHAVKAKTTVGVTGLLMMAASALALTH